MCHLLMKKKLCKSTLKLKENFQLIVLVYNRPMFSSRAGGCVVNAVVLVV